MSLTKRKRRSDFGIKRGPIREREEARRLASLAYDQRELATLARFSEKRLAALVAAINDGKQHGQEIAEAPIGGLSEVYDIEHVAQEVARRGWPPFARP